MSAKQSPKHALKDIPVRVEPAAPRFSFHWRRRLVQFLFLLILVLIPLSGLLRIDPVAGAFVILDRQVWWSDFFLVFGLWMLLAASLVLLYSTLGTAFCGWACPQNTLAELANLWTYRLLGKRADVSVSGEKMKIAGSKNHWSNWLLLSLLLITASLLMALIPLFYFYPPSVIWSFISFQQDERLASSLHYIYTIFVLVILVDISFIRHFWCRFMCIYKVWQHGFKTAQTLHLEYDESRSASCEKCNYCNTVCFLGLDPRRTDIYDTCINCGECVDACNTVQAKRGETSLLSLKRGIRDKKILASVSRYAAALSTRIQWTIPFALLGGAMFVWGLVDYQHFHLAVYRADTEHGANINDYRVAVSHKLYQQAGLTLSVEGLAEDSYSLSSSKVEFKTAERIDLNLHIFPQLASGLHSILVHAESDTGWRDSYRLQHFVESR